jgi:hypothetical protein
MSIVSVGNPSRVRTRKLLGRVIDLPSLLIRRRRALLAEHVWPESERKEEMASSVLCCLQDEGGGAVISGRIFLNDDYVKLWCP